MSKLIRRTKKNFGAALLIALQMITLTLAGLLMPLAGGPQQQRSAPPQDGFAVANNAPAVSQMSATQTQTAQAPTASAKDALCFGYPCDQVVRTARHGD